MARRIVPFAEVLDIVERDSYLEEDSSGDEEPIFSGSVVQEDAESDNISEFVGGRVPESDKERDLTDNRELEPSVVSSTPTIGQLLDDASLTPSATLSNAPEQVQTTRGRGRGRGRGYVGGDEQRLRREYRGGRKGRGRSRSIGRGKGSSRDVGRGNSTGRGEAEAEGEVDKGGICCQVLNLQTLPFSGPVLTLTHHPDI